MSAKTPAIASFIAPPTPQSGDLASLSPAHFWRSNLLEPAGGSSLCRAFGWWPAFFSRWKAASKIFQETQLHLLVSIPLTRALHHLCSLFRTQPTGIHRLCQIFPLARSLSFKTSVKEGCRAYLTCHIPPLSPRALFSSKTQEPNPPSTPHRHISHTTRFNPELLHHTSRNSVSALCRPLEPRIQHLATCDNGERNQALRSAGRQADGHSG